MKSEIKIIKKIKVSEGDRFLELSFRENEFAGFDSNLPYQKSLEDWEFYGRAISKIIKLVKSKGGK